jgi:hypothetical protein
MHAYEFEQNLNPSTCLVIEFDRSALIIGRTPQGQRYLAPVELVALVDVLRELAELLQ